MMDGFLFSDHLEHWEIQKQEPSLQQFGFEGVGDICIVYLIFWTQIFVHICPRAVTISLDLFGYEIDRGIQESFLVCLHHYIVSLVWDQFEEIAKIHLLLL